MFKKINLVQLFSQPPKQFNSEPLATSPKSEKLLNADNDDSCKNVVPSANNTENHETTAAAELLLNDQEIHIVKKSKSSQCKVNYSKIKSSQGVLQSIKQKLSSTFVTISHSPEQPSKKGTKEIKGGKDNKSNDCPGRSSKNLLNIRAKCGGKESLYHLPSKGASEWLETAAIATSPNDSCTLDSPASLYALPEVVLSSNQSLDKASNKLKTANWLLGSSAYTKGDCYSPCKEDSVDLHDDGHLHYGSNMQLLNAGDNDDFKNQSCLSPKSNLSYMIQGPDKNSTNFDNKENQIESEQFISNSHSSRTNIRALSLANHASKIVTANSVHSILSPDPEPNKQNNNNHHFFENYKFQPTFHLNKKKSKKSQLCNKNNNLIHSGSGSNSTVHCVASSSKFGSIDDYGSGIKYVTGEKNSATIQTNVSASAVSIISAANLDPEAPISSSICASKPHSISKSLAYAPCGDRQIPGRRPPKPIGFAGLPPIREDPIGGPAPPVPPQQVHLNWSQEFRDISCHGWYWGPISSCEAEKKLSDQPDGKFLVRDSSHNTYLLSLSFRSNGKTYHTRIEHRNGLFSLCPMSEHGGYRSLVKLIETVIANSTDGVFCYTKPRNGGILPAFPVRLCSPLSRFSQVRPLQHLCCFVIHQHTRLDLIERLPVPQTIKGYLAQKPSQ